MTVSETFGAETSEQVAKRDFDKRRPTNKRLSSDEKAIYDELFKIALKYTDEINKTIRNEELSKEQKKATIKSLKQQCEQEADTVVGGNHQEFIDSTTYKAAATDGYNPIQFTSIMAGFEQAESIISDM